MSDVQFHIPITQFRENHYIRVCRVQAIVPISLFSLAALTFIISFEEMLKFYFFQWAEFCDENKRIFWHIQKYCFSNWNLRNKLITPQTCVEAAPLLGYFKSPKESYVISTLNHMVPWISKGVLRWTHFLYKTQLSMLKFSKNLLFSKNEMFWNTLFFDMKSSNLIIIGQLCVKVAPTLELLQSSRDSYVVGTLNF
jgi:hypothetical protein